MFKIIKYVFLDLIRSKWAFLILSFFAFSGWGLLYFSTSLSKAILSIMHINIFVVPMISVVLTSIYYYNSRDYIELLLAQPVKRKSVFLGQYVGVSSAISLSFLLGNIIPFLIYGTFISTDIWSFFNLILNGILIIFIFVGFTFNICLLINDKIKGFGIVILMLLYFSILYDGLVLGILLYFKEYPLEKLSIILTLLNPIDLSRINTLLQLDISVLMGYTGASFQKFFGTFMGLIISYSSFVIWILFNLLVLHIIIRKKDF